MYACVHVTLIVGKHKCLHFRDDGEGQECCFDNSGLLLTGPPSGGTVDRFASRLLTNPWDHIINDIIPQIHCCRAPTSSDSTCQTYYTARRSDNCGAFNPAPPGKGSYIVKISLAIIIIMYSSSVW